MDSLGCHNVETERTRVSHLQPHSYKMVVVVVVVIAVVSRYVIVQSNDGNDYMQCTVILKNQP